MSSRRIEDKHVSMLKDLIAGTGLLECVRPLEEYSLEEELEPEPEEILLDETVVHEEHMSPEAEFVEISAETLLEEEPSIFPTPSLRYLLPDSTRDIEKYNRLEVLPPKFNKDIDPTKIPIIATTPPGTYIEILGDIVGCDTYTYSLAEFWFLDTLANLLRRGQEDGMSKDGQALMILWFCEWMQEMKHFDAASRERMVRRFKRNMLAAAKFIGSEDRIPMPDEIGVNHLTNKIGTPRTSQNDMLRRLVEVTMMEGGTPYECALRDLVQIIHFIFDLTDYQYELVRSVFTFAPDYVRIDCPYQIQKPKRLYTTLPKPKPKKEPKKDKKEKKDPKMDKKAAAAVGKVKESPPTADYRRLMDLMESDAQAQAELEEKEREEWYRKNSILPLQQAADEEFFNKYWPPPPPEPEPVVVTKPEQKKGKK